MTGEMITFSSNGGTATGYLAAPAEGKGPGVVVIQEWWGLVPHIKRVADRFAASGFLALAPDLYRGKATKSPGEAQKLMMAMNIDQAEKDLAGAVSYLNTKPLVYGLASLAPQHELVFDLPSRLADHLAAAFLMSMMLSSGFDGVSIQTIRVRSSR